MKYSLTYSYSDKTKTVFFESNTDLNSLLTENNKYILDVLSKTDLKLAIKEALEGFVSTDKCDENCNIDVYIKEELQAEIDQGIVFKADFDDKERLKDVFDADREFASSLSCSGEVDEIGNKTVILNQYDKILGKESKFDFTVGDFDSYIGIECPNYNGMDHTKALIDEYLDNANSDDFLFCEK